MVRPQMEMEKEKYTDIPLDFPVQKAILPSNFVDGFALPPRLRIGLLLMLFQAGIAPPDQDLQIHVLGRPG